MPRAPWEGWAHFSDYSGTDPKHPHKCRSCGKVLPDDAVVARKHLAFHCSSFAESEVLAREGYVLSFVGTKTKLTQEEESAKNTVLKQRGKRPAEGDAEDVEGKNEVCASAPGVSENVFLHGLRCLSQHQSRGALLATSWRARVVAGQLRGMVEQALPPPRPCPRRASSR